MTFFQQTRCSKSSVFGHELLILNRRKSDKKITAYRGAYSLSVTSARDRPPAQEICRHMQLSWMNLLTVDVGKGAKSSLVFSMC